MENRVPRPFFSHLVLSFFLIASFVSSGGFYEDVDITWGDGRGKIEEGGNVLSLSLDRTSGSGFQSKIEFLFGRFDVQMKLVPNNSAGTVTTLYLTSQGENHDEIDLEFLGNLSGDPYTLHTNVYTQGKGEREQQFQLWFDPTADYHTYSIVWNPHRIIIFVDNIPIRELANKESIGIPYPKTQPMRIYGSLWDGDQWATRGGQVKTDWSNAPFLAHYRNYNAQTTDSKGSKDWMNVELDATGRKLLRWVQKYHMIYNYCTDRTRHHDRRECRRS